MKINSKKGFTIVELVIVIAVIAILAAVLIPNLSRLVTKADKSAAMQEAKAAMDNDLINAEGDLENMTKYATADTQYYIVKEVSKYNETVTSDSGNVIIAVTSSTVTASPSNTVEGAKYYEAHAYEGKYTVASNVGTYEYTTKDQKFVCKLVTGGEWVITEAGN